MSPDQKKVLAVLASMYANDWGYLNFAGISKHTSLPRKIVRRCCRALARKGFAEYGKGLWNKDGEVAGAGYCCTNAGYEASKQDNNNGGAG